jgi:hypothetical protein
MPATEITGTADTSFVWLVNESSVANERFKNLIRTNAAAWGYRGGHKQVNLQGPCQDLDKDDNKDCL